MARELPTPPPAAQITICGALNTVTIAALVELAMAAGAGLLLQPRSLGTAPADIVEASPVRKALPPRRQIQRKPKPAKPIVPPAAPAALDERVRRALKDGPMQVGEFIRETRMNKREAQRLVDAGLIEAFGVTRGRRYALPGHSAKEAP